MVCSVSKRGEIKRREKLSILLTNLFPEAVDQLATLKAAVDRVECRLARQWASVSESAADGLITALLAEIRGWKRIFPSDDSAFRGAQGLEQDYHRYREQRREAQFRYARDQRLSADERNELKRLWRQASRLSRMYGRR